MKNVIYQEKIRNFDKSRDEMQPPQVCVTNEANGFGVFLYTENEGAELLEYLTTGGQSEAIRRGFFHAEKIRKERVNL